MLNTEALIESVKRVLAEAARTTQSQIDSLVHERDSGTPDAEMAQLYSDAIAALEKVKTQTTRPTREAVARELIASLAPLGIPLSLGDTGKRIVRRRRKHRQKAPV